MPRRSQHSSRRVPSSTAQRRCPVAGVPCASVNRRLQRVSLRCFLRRLPLRRCVRNRISLCRPGRHPTPDNPPPTVVVQRPHRDPKPSRNRRAAQTRTQKTVRFPRHVGINCARTAPAARLMKPFLPLAPVPVHCPLHRGTTNAERRRQIFPTDPVLREPRDPKPPRPDARNVVRVKRLQVCEIHHPFAINVVRKARSADRSGVRGRHRKCVHEILGYRIMGSYYYARIPPLCQPQNSIITLSIHTIIQPTTGSRKESDVRTSDITQIQCVRGT